MKKLVLALIIVGVMTGISAADLLITQSSEIVTVSSTDANFEVISCRSTDTISCCTSEAFCFSECSKKDFAIKKGYSVVLSQAIVSFKKSHRIYMEVMK